MKCSLTLPELECKSYQLWTEVIIPIGYRAIEVYLTDRVIIPVHIITNSLNSERIKLIQCSHDFAVLF